jgi:heme/copper-type cytochrome/quinol oxidase subunit 4
LKIVKNNNLNIFSGYCIILGLISIIITSLWWMVKISFQEN